MNYKVLVMFLGILMMLSCKSHYNFKPIEIPRIYYYPVDTTEEKWIQPKFIYSELYPVSDLGGSLKEDSGFLPTFTLRFAPLSKTFSTSSTKSSL